MPNPSIQICRDTELAVNMRTLCLSYIFLIMAIFSGRFSQICRVGQFVWELFYIFSFVMVTGWHGEMLPRIAWQSGTQNPADTEYRETSSFPLVSASVNTFSVFTSLAFFFSFASSLQIVLLICQSVMPKEERFLY